jgi:hypothetical protein
MVAKAAPATPLTDRICGRRLYVGAPLASPADLPASVGEWHAFTLHALPARGLGARRDLSDLRRRLTLAVDGPSRAPQ